MKKIGSEAVKKFVESDERLSKAVRVLEEIDEEVLER